MATAQACHSMTTYYLNKYHEKYHHKPNVNRHKARWGFDSVLQDMTPSKAQALVDFYLETHSTNRHSLEWFFYNYDKLIDRKHEYEKDEAEREQLRLESKRRVEEWRKQPRYGNIGSEDPSGGLSE